MNKYQQKNIDSLFSKISVKLKDSSVQRDPMTDENGRFLQEFKNEKVEFVLQNKIISQPSLKSSTSTLFCHICMIYIPALRLDHSKVQIIKVNRVDFFNNLNSQTYQEIQQFLLSQTLLKSQKTFQASDYFLFDCDGNKKEIDILFKEIKERNIVEIVVSKLQKLE